MCKRKSRLFVVCILKHGIEQRKNISASPPAARLAPSRINIRGLRQLLQQIEKNTIARCLAHSPFSPSMRSLSCPQMTGPASSPNTTQHRILPPALDPTRLITQVPIHTQPSRSNGHSRRACSRRPISLRAMSSCTTTESLCSRWKAM